jgi:hypothetical protein
VALVRSLRAQNKSARAIVRACAELGHVVSLAAVGRIIAPASSRRPRRSEARPPAELLARHARRLAGADGVAAAELLEQAAAALRGSIGASSASP